jgi:preprotein translocase subunit YajC
VNLVDASGLIFLILMMVIFYFLLIRPQKRRAQQHRTLIDSLEVGDEVVTIGGLHGKVARLGGDDVDLEVSPGTTLRFVKTAIARRVTEPTPEEEREPHEEEAT